MSHTINKQDVAQEILRAVEELQLGSGFGSVEIVLHEGRVTQIEKREKLRFTQDVQKNKPSVPVFTSRAVAGN
ncbi:MAG TPA: YezD family protein [Methylotenera sp.]|nr:YezD family protein [Methylotenera sp.]